MYLEVTPEETIRDLQFLLIDAIPNFEFPRCDLSDYTITTEVKNADEVEDVDFILRPIWNDLDDFLDENAQEKVLVERSVFNVELTSEEINILAILMMVAWVQRQVTSIENTRMKYSGPDFKMTSQANHLQKLLTLLAECQRQSHHMQRLYKRRRVISETDNRYRSNWDVFGRGVYYDRYNY